MKPDDKTTRKKSKNKCYKKEMTSTYYLIAHAWKQKLLFKRNKPEKLTGRSKQKFNFLQKFKAV